MPKSMSGSQRKLLGLGGRRHLERVQHVRDHAVVDGDSGQLDEPWRAVAVLERIEDLKFDAVRPEQLPHEGHERSLVRSETAHVAAIAHGGDGLLAHPRLAWPGDVR